MLPKKTRLPVVLLGLAGAMVVLLVAVLVVKLGSGSRPPQVQSADLGPVKVVSPQVSESVPSGELKVSFENKSSGKVTLLCGSKKNCILDTGKSCELVLPPDTKCEASATGFHSHAIDVAEAKSRAGKGQAIHIPLHLDAEKPTGKVSKVKKSKPKGKKR